MKKIPFLLSFSGGYFIILIDIYRFSLLRQRRDLPPEIKDLIQKEDARLIQIDDIRIEKESGSSIAHSLYGNRKRVGADVCLELPCESRMFEKFVNK